MKTIADVFRARTAVENYRAAQTALANAVAIDSGTIRMTISKRYPNGAVDHEVVTSLKAFVVDQPDSLSRRIIAAARRDVIRDAELRLAEARRVLVQLGISPEEGKETET